MTPLADRCRRGMTLIEISISVLILAAVIGVPIMLLVSGSRAYAIEAAAAAANEAVRQGVDGISARLTTAISAGILPPANQSEWIEYNRGIGYQGGAASASPGPTERIQFEYSPTDPDDGLDNDLDGLVDEGLVVWIENPGLPGQRRLTLVDTVPEAQAGEVLGNNLDDNGNGLVDEMGLAFDITTSRVAVCLTIVSPAPDGSTLVRNLERTVAFRN